MRGDFAQALPLARRATDLAQINGLVSTLPFCLSVLGLSVSGLGRPEEGVPLIERGIETAETRRIMFWHRLSVGALAEAHWLAADLERSADIANKGLGLARRYLEPGSEAWFHCVLGDVCVAMNSDLSVAEEHYRAALALAEGLRLRPFVARCHAGLAAVCTRRGNSRAAKQHFRTATAMYREMRMTYWLQKAEARMDPTRRPLPRAAP
jgi:tetratricopeptide (TPR) repeat protein